MIRIAHIINPVKVKPTSDLYIAQPITFETMRRAKAFAHADVEVTLYTTQYPEDHEILPADFTILPDLTRSVQDVATFEVPRKLPLLKDLLDRLYEGSEADYFIYTNTDIALMPHFYEAVANFIKRGHDGIVINRRSIPNTYTNVDEIPLMYAELGTKHPGFDCLVFKRCDYPDYELRDTCIGAAWIGRILLWNIVLHSEKFLFLNEPHLTFHIGEDRSWLNPKLRDYRDHNYAQGYAVMAALEARHGDITANPILLPFLKPALDTGLNGFFPRLSRQIMRWLRRSHSV